MTSFRILRTSVLPIAAAIVLIGCSSGSVPATGVPGASAPAPTASPPSAPPDAAIGTDAPPTDDGAGKGDLAGRIVVPRPGTRDPRPIPAERLSAIVDGRHVVVTVTWTSGVEPCTVLDSIIVATGDHTFDITLREGSGPEDVACIEIAETKRALVDLGDLAPGTYTVSDATGGAAPIEVVVS
jgi:hypothetical protein